MSRSVPEWIAKHDDEAIPPRVKDRLFRKAGGQCATCTRTLAAGEGGPQFDHVLALCNGGEHRESNLQLICSWCHKEKTKEDVAAKAAAFAARMSHLGFRPTSKRTMPHGKNSATKRKMTGEVVRR